jgi:hypothetical protein
MASARHCVLAFSAVYFEILYTILFRIERHIRMFSANLEERVRASSFCWNGAGNSVPFRSNGRSGRRGARADPAAKSVIWALAHWAHSLALTADSIPEG